jgi:hypothetical protein
MSHTSGPWTYQGARNYEGFSIAPRETLPTLASVERCGPNRIAVECFNFPGETEDNARLIAAAPALLAACQASELSRRYPLRMDLEVEAKRATREAIAAATGPAESEPAP